MELKMEIKNFIDKNSKSLPVLVFALLISLSGFFRIDIPGTPIPAVLQNFFCILAGCTLGAIKGAASTGIFLSLGMIGLPVFSGFQGGTAHLGLASGLFLPGYFIAALLCGAIAKSPAAKPASLPRLILAAAAGYISVYIPGAWGFMSYNEMKFTWQNLQQTLDLCVKPFLVGDTLKLIATVTLSASLRPLIVKFCYKEKN